MLEEFTALLRQVAEGMIEQAQVERGARWLDNLAQEYPVAYGLLNSALYKTPKDVMKFLCMIVPELRQFKNNAHVLDYISKLQKELRGNRNDGLRTGRTTKSVSLIRRS